MLTKNTGAVVWPQGTAPTAEQTTSSRFNEWRTVPWPPDTKALERQAFMLSTVQERYVVGTNLQELIAVIKSAKSHPRQTARHREFMIGSPTRAQSDLKVFALLGCLWITDRAFGTRVDLRPIPIPRRRIRTGSCKYFAVLVPFRRHSQRESEGISGCHFVGVHR